MGTYSGVRLIGRQISLVLRDYNVMTPLFFAGPSPGRWDLNSTLNLTAHHTTYPLTKLIIVVLFSSRPACIGMAIVCLSNAGLLVAECVLVDQDGWFMLVENCELMSPTFGWSGYADHYSHSNTPIRKISYSIHYLSIRNEKLDLVSCRAPRLRASPFPVPDLFCHFLSLHRLFLPFNGWTP